MGIKKKTNTRLFSFLDIKARDKNKSCVPKD